ncbi:hypothetical protein BaRGS_00009402 [Batillaria attramentaria]|uniref:Uncharacterized protein n=1 Tax=Batillaria attramentaria TaxID=370345 RepID=A0ABD0LIR2_9CAEN
MHTYLPSPPTSTEVEEQRKGLISAKVYVRTATPISGQRKPSVGTSKMQLTGVDKGGSLFGRVKRCLPKLNDELQIEQLYNNVSPVLHKYDRVRFLSMLRQPGLDPLFVQRLWDATWKRKGGVECFVQAVLLQDPDYFQLLGVQYADPEHQRQYEDYMQREGYDISSMQSLQPNQNDWHPIQPHVQTHQIMSMPPAERNHRNAIPGSLPGVGRNQNSFHHPGEGNYTCHAPDQSEITQRDLVKNATLFLGQPRPAEPDRTSLNVRGSENSQAALQELPMDRSSEESLQSLSTSSTLTPHSGGSRRVDPLCGLGPRFPAAFPDSHVPSSPQNILGSISDNNIPAQNNARFLSLQNETSEREQSLQNMAPTLLSLQNMSFGEKNLQNMPPGEQRLQNMPFREQSQQNMFPRQQILQSMSPRQQTLQNMSPREQSLQNMSLRQQSLPNLPSMEQVVPSCGDIQSDSEPSYPLSRRDDLYTQFSSDPPSNRWGRENRGRDVQSSVSFHRGMSLPNPPFAVSVKRADHVVFGKHVIINNYMVESTPAGADSDRLSSPGSQTLDASCSGPVSQNDTTHLMSHRGHRSDVGSVSQHGNNHLLDQPPGPDMGQSPFHRTTVSSEQGGLCSSRETEMSGVSAANLSTTGEHHRTDLKTRAAAEEPTLEQRSTEAAYGQETLPRPSPPSLLLTPEDYRHNTQVKAVNELDSICRSAEETFLPEDPRHMTTLKTVHGSASETSNVEGQGGLGTMASARDVHVPRQDMSDSLLSSVHLSPSLYHETLPKAFESYIPSDTTESNEDVNHQPGVETQETEPTLYLPPGDPAHETNLKSMCRETSEDAARPHSELGQHLVAEARAEDSLLYGPLSVSSRQPTCLAGQDCGCC